MTIRVTMIHAVPDYDRWVEVVLETKQHMPGVRRMTVHRSIDEPNEIMVELEVESIEIARSVVGSPRLREFLDRAGIDIYPPVFVGQQVDELSS